MPQPVLNARALKCSLVLNAAEIADIGDPTACQYQPAGRGGSWRGSVREARRQIADLIEESPTLEPYPATRLAWAYGHGREKAEDDAGLLDLPTECPWTIEQLLDRNFWPGLPSEADEPLPLALHAGDGGPNNTVTSLATDDVLRRSAVDVVDDGTATPFAGPGRQPLAPLPAAAHGTCPADKANHRGVVPPRKGHSVDRLFVIHLPMARRAFHALRLACSLPHRTCPP